VRLAFSYARLESLELVRLPSFIVPTLLFPALFFLCFVVPGAGHGQADLLLASYVGFAFLGIAFFQFGVGIAAERTSPWEGYLRTLPAAPRTRFAGKVCSALALATASGLVVVAVALATTPARLGGLEWLLLATGLLAGSIPFVLLGIALGYLCGPKSALPLANLLYLGLAYLGGVWTGSDRLPGSVAVVSPYLPTRVDGDPLGRGRRHDRRRPVLGCARGLGRCIRSPRGLGVPTR
jgi:ABC-2 type transport system permease protein